MSQRPKRQVELGSEMKISMYTASNHVVIFFTYILILVIQTTLKHNYTIILYTILVFTVIADGIILLCVYYNLLTLLLLLTLCYFACCL